MSLPTVTVTGTLLDASQQPLSGEVVFTPATGDTNAGGNPVITSITDAAGMVIIAMTGVTEELNRGTFSVDLIPTDTAALSPAGWAYQVTVNVSGIPAYSNLYYIPSTRNPVDLSQLVAVSDVTSAPAEWSPQAPAGSLQQWNFRLTVPGSPSPYDITGTTWEYVVRGADGGGSPLIEVTTSASTDGLLTVTGTDELSSLLLALYPAATVDLPPGTYPHALWANPGTPSALAIVTGSLTVQAAPQP